jgi:diguanylate cyclase (GGDEF)-like protein/PAS domain S-box-containing protein
MKNIFALPSIADEKDTQTSRLLNIFLWSFMLAMTVMILIAIVLPETTRRQLLLVGTVDISSVLLLILTRRGYTRLVSWMVILQVWVVTTAVVSTGGGIHNPAVTLYLIVVLIAGLMLGRTTGLIIAGICLLTELVLVHFEQADLLLPSIVQHNALTLWVANTGAMIIIVGIQYFASSTFKGSFDRIYRELNERKLVEAELRASEQRFRAIFDSVNDAISIHDLATGEILFVNQRLCDFTGYTREEARMINIATLSSGEPPYTAKEALKWLKEAADGSPQLIQWHVKDKQGHLFWVEVNMRRASIDGQERMVLVARNISERKNMEERLAESERRLRLITDNMMDLITLVDVNGKVEYLSPSHTQVLGYGTEELMKKWDFNLIHPDDRDGLFQAFRETTRLAKHRTAIYRFRHADGHYIWLETVGNVVQDERGKNTEAILSSRDISERKQTEEALKRSEEKYRQILDNIDDGYFEVDLAGNFTLFNDVLPNVLGYSREELMGKNFRLVMDAENAKMVFEVFNKVYQTGVPVRLVEWESMKRDGSKLYVETSVFPIKDVDGRPMGFRGVVRDITERKRMYDKIHIMAVTDDLTGLYNRRGFITLAEQQLKTAGRTRTKMLLTFVDLDDMKHINDVWGHDEGDRALVGAAKVLRQTFRDSDIIARIGGDEYAVLAPDVKGTTQDVFMARLQQKLDEFNAHENRGYRLSLSKGHTFYDPQTPCSLDQLISRADKLMYEDKHRKRNTDEKV